MVRVFKTITSYAYISMHYAYHMHKLMSLFSYIISGAKDYIFIK